MLHLCFSRIVVCFILFSFSCFCRFSVSLYWLCVQCLLPVGVIKKNNTINMTGSPSRNVIDQLGHQRSFNIGQILDGQK